MALEKTFRKLSFSLHKLHDALNALQVTVGDKPPNDEAAVADGVGNATLDLIGGLHEARKSALRACKAIEHPPDLDCARRELARCQSQFHRIEQQFASELVSYDKLSELSRLGRSRRHEWLPWGKSVRLGIEQCREPLDHGSRALAECWQELAERIGAVNISMKATNVGQNITVPKSKLEEFEVERVS